MNFEERLLGDEVNMNDSISQVLNRSEQPIDKRRGSCKNAFIERSVFYVQGGRLWVVCL